MRRILTATTFIAAALFAADLAREQTLVSKRILFLSKSQKMFQLWHIIHRPFSYS